MSRSHFARTSVTLVIVAALSSPPAWGAPNRLPGEQWLDIFSRAFASLTEIWRPAGLRADPHGGPATDEGCNGDPRGCSVLKEKEPPVAVPTADEGNSLDPHGGPKP